MTKFIVIEKDSLNKATLDTSNISLSEASIVHTKMSRNDVAEFVRDGNNLILKLKNGEIIAIKNFFVADENGVVSDLVFEEDGCTLYWFPGSCSYDFWSVEAHQNRSCRFIVRSFQSTFECLLGNRVPCSP